MLHLDYRFLHQSNSRVTTVGVTDKQTHTWRSGISMYGHKGGLYILFTGSDITLTHVISVGMMQKTRQTRSAGFQSKKQPSVERIQPYLGGAV